MRVGVLALQGGFAEHVAMLRRVGLEGQGNGHGGSGPIVVTEVRLPAQLDAVDGLIIPGGESTTIGKLLVEYGLLDSLRRRIAGGLPVLGTCAGAILLAKDVGGRDQPLLGAMNLTVRRNAFGRQTESFETDLRIATLGDPPLRAVFIRAPVIVAVGEGVDTLATLADGTIVAARQGNLLATAFHPELTGDARLHAYFAAIVAEHVGADNGQ